MPQFVCDDKQLPEFFRSQGIFHGSFQCFKPADARELTGELVRDSVFYCDSVESVMAESGDFLIPLREGLFGEEHLRGTLGELLLGRKPGRTSPEEITVYESLGLAVEDIACAEALCRPAAKL